MGDVLRPRLPHDPLPRRRRVVEKHYVSKRSRRQKGMLAFLARTPTLASSATPTASCARTSKRRGPPLRRVLEAADRPPSRGTHFRLQADDLRQPRQVEPDGGPVHHAPTPVEKAPRRDRANAGVGWRRIELENVSRAYKTPRVLDRRLTLNDYDGPLRQLTVADLGMSNRPCS